MHEKITVSVDLSAFIQKIYNYLSDSPDYFFNLLQIYF